MNLTRLWSRLAGVAALAGTLSCAPSESEAPPKYTLVMGVDVSGSFVRSGGYEDAINFAAYYLYGHLNGLNGLRVPSAVLVGSVGGERAGETKAFHPIHEFTGKSVEEIATQLRGWFPPGDDVTDFNVFFQRAADLVKRQNLVLTPLNVVLLSDGVPDLGRVPGDSLAHYASISVGPLEYLSRNTTVRLLYPAPPIAVRWEQNVQRKRVRLWTLDGQVMAGWRGQLTPDLPPANQDRLWTWMKDNVDFRVRGTIL
ncbi:MAG: hypothetical protein HY560_07795 [Gemmatimonadetes bacterium]|nr:hypothetical protein [Gemmatimonadota bacterium]